MGTSERLESSDERTARARAVPWLLLLNALVFAAWHFDAAGPFLREHFTVSGVGLLEHGRGWTLLTSPFSHMQAAHLFWNLMFLYAFGGLFEATHARRDVVFLYLFAGVGGVLTQVGIDTGRGHPEAITLGASAPVFALVVAVFVQDPRRAVRFVGDVQVPLWLFAALFVAVDLSGLIDTVTGRDDGVVAHAGHLAGAAAGLLFKLLDLRLLPLPEAGGDTVRVRRATDEVPLDDRLPELAVPADGDPLNERVDDLLRKISEGGLASLSADERAFLDEASQEYRRRSARHTAVIDDEPPVGSAV